MAADQIGALLGPKEEAADSPEAVPAGILAHPAVQAEIARQVALYLGKAVRSIYEVPPSPLLVLSDGSQRREDGTEAAPSAPSKRPQVWVENNAIKCTKSR
jgi:hypothetical protein